MRNRSILIAIFVLLEIAFFVELGKYFGTGAVIFETIFSAFIGYIVIKNTTRLTGMRARLAVWNMQLPARNMVRSFMLLIGGVTLIIPGVITDFLGVILILPMTQSLVLRHFQHQCLRIFKQ